MADPFIKDGTVNFYCEWSELRELAVRYNAGEKNVLGSPYDEQMSSWFLGGAWEGFSREELHEWLTKGYRPNVLRNVGFSPPIRDKRKLVFAEEGDEFHYELAENGDDNVFSYFTKRETMPGAELEIVTSFVSGTPSSVVTDFGNWVGRAVTSLEASGIDCGVSIGSMSPMFLGTGEGRNKEIRVMTRVKKEGKTSDITSWSPMLSPAMFRAFCHALGIILAHRYGDKQYNRGMYRSHPANTSWKIEWDKKRRVIVISNPFDARHFPELEMTDRFREVLKEMQKNI